MRRRRSVEILATLAFAAARGVVWLFAARILQGARPARRWRPRVTVSRHMRAAFLAALPCMIATWARGGLVLSLGGSLTSGVLGEHGRIGAELPIFLMAGTSAIASVRLRGAWAGATVRGGLLALTVGVGIALAALALRSGTLFLLGAIVSGLGG